MNGEHFESLCTRHFNMKIRDDLDFRARYEAAQADVARLREVEVAERVRREAERVAAVRAAEEARRAAEAAARRAEKIAKRDRHVADAANLGAIKIIDHARKAVDIWSSNNITGFAVPQAYVALAYMPQTHAGFLPLMTAVIRLRFQSFGNHPDVASYRDVPEAERADVLAALSAALIPYGGIDLIRVLSESDPVRALVVARVRAEEEAARRAAAVSARI